MPQIKAPPSRGLWYIVVIPAYLEDTIFDTLTSLKNTSPVDGGIEVLVVVNYSEVDTPDNKKSNQSTYNSIAQWCYKNSSPDLRFFALLASDLPARHAGAGLARKIGMDEALHRFGLVDNSLGLILSLDADTQVSSDYFLAIANEFKSSATAGGCVFNFAHPIEGSEFPEAIYRAVTLYELHLRYYKYALKLSGFPYTYYTIGSCFGVRADFYAQQGGMNRRKAGEDFYFLNKLFPHRSFREIKGTCVYPSPRPSLRVPFGTGPVIKQLVETDEMRYLTYNLQAFIDLKSLFGSVPVLYNLSKNEFDSFLHQLSEPLKAFLSQNDFQTKLSEIKKNTASENAFYKRFFLWFNGFKVVKFLNFSHDQHYQKADVSKAAIKLLTVMNFADFNEDPRSLLLFFRELDNKL